MADFEKARTSSRVSAAKRGAPAKDKVDLRALMGGPEEGSVGRLHCIKYNGALKYHENQSLQDGISWSSRLIGKSDPAWAATFCTEAIWRKARRPARCRLSAPRLAAGFPCPAPPASAVQLLQLPKNSQVLQARHGRVCIEVHPVGQIHDLALHHAKRGIEPG